MMIRRLLARWRLLTRAVRAVRSLPARLASRYRRRHDCPAGEHREAIEWSFGVCYARCLDCDRRESFGHVVHGASNRQAAR